MLMLMLLLLLLLLLLLSLSPVFRGGRWNRRQKVPEPGVSKGESLDAALAAEFGQVRELEAALVAEL
jgi:hypothetical protein